MNTTILPSPPRGISPRDTYLRVRKTRIRDAEMALLTLALAFPEGSPARRRAVLRARVFREVARVVEETAAPVPFVLLRGRCGWPPDSALDAVLSALLRDGWLVETAPPDPHAGSCRRLDLGPRARSY